MKSRSLTMLTAIGLIAILAALSLLIAQNGCAPAPSTVTQTTTATVTTGTTPATGLTTTGTTTVPTGTVSLTTTLPPITYPYPNYGPGGMMGPGGYMGPGMMGGGWQYSGTRISLEAALGIAQSYLTSRGDANLKINEIEEYQYNFYVEVAERNTGLGAFEMLVDPYSSTLYPEPGPNMMWNTKYGMMSGVIWGLPGPTAPLTISAAQARTLGQQYLDSAQSGAQVGDATTFYGYYTMNITKGGQIFGMLSVNGYTGQVWYHTWHGQFVQEREIT